MNARILGLLAAVLGFSALAAPALAQEGLFDKTVLALYKSSDNQSEKENEVYYYLSIPLKEMGLSVRYWDIDRGLPPVSLTLYTRAIITWFRGPSMNNVDFYLDFLDSQIDQGKKVLVFDNFGAYQERRTGEYVQPLRLNTTLARLGLIYQGDWTQDGSKLRLATVDSAMVEAGAKQDAGLSAFFYHFLPVDRDLRTWLSISRSDRDYPPSPVIVTNSKGGFALSRYIYRVEGGKIILLLNMKAFLTEALFPDYGQQRLAILADPSTTQRKSILFYAENIVSRLKVPYRVILAKDFPGMVPLDLRPYSAAFLILGDDAGLDPAILETLLKKGGGIASLSSANFTSLAPVLGIKGTTARAGVAVGFKMSSRLHTGENLELQNRTLQWTPGPMVPSDTATILATDYRGATPLAWSQQRGRGTTLVWNWNEFQSGAYIGTIAEALQFVQGWGALPTPAVSLFNLDDWPLPMYDIKKAPLSTTDTEFYMNTWWPQVDQILQREGFPISSFMIFNYNAQNQAPFFTGEFFANKSNAPLTLARQAVTMGYELGLHGYNHVSLTRQASQGNPVQWMDLDNMKKSLEQAKRDWIRLLGSATLPRGYVAPQNVISDEGISVLKSVFPSIKTVSTSYFGSGEKGASDFGPHPTIRDVYMMPRTVAGYHLDDDAKLATISGILGPGVYAHFIHADDIFDPVRSQGDSWDVLRLGLEKNLQYVDKQFPWLRKMSTYQAYRALQRYDATLIDVRKVGAVTTIECSDPGTLFRVRTGPNGLGTVMGGTVEYAYSTFPEAIIRSDGPTVTITDNPPGAAAAP